MGGADHGMKHDAGQIGLVTAKVAAGALKSLYNFTPSS
jgi:hypothetical protein